jgi:hypothetical protein
VEKGGVRKEPEGAVFGGYQAWDIPRDAPMNPKNDEELKPI